MLQCKLRNLTIFFPNMNPFPQSYLLNIVLKRILRQVSHRYQVCKKIQNKIKRKNKVKKNEF